MNALDAIRPHAYNALGWRTKHHIVVFESDDWGGIRTPDRQTLRALASTNQDLSIDEFDAHDCLESGADLDALAEVLYSAARLSDSSPCFTFNTVMQNPDFEMIAASGFTRYVARGLFSSYRHYHGEELQPRWDAMQREGLIRPQFHAREHLNVSLWMKDLREGRSATRAAFHLGCFGQMQETSAACQSHYLAAYHAVSTRDLAEKQSVVAEGLRLFEETFAYPSDTLIPCNYVWPDGLEQELATAGVSAVQGGPVMKVPDTGHGGRLRYRRRFLRRSGRGGLVQLVRNAIFEPYACPDRDVVPETLRQIDIAFRWSKPAVLSSHRINYVGGLNQKHRDRSLRQLTELLGEIVRRWPDVEFMTSDQLAALLLKKPG